MSLRNFTVNNINVVFNTEYFRLKLKELREKNKLPFWQLEQQLADKLDISADTIHGWHYGKNGPIDIEVVKQLAQAIEIKDFTMLLKTKKDQNNMTQLTNRQKNAVKRIYDICICFLEKFRNTDGFNDYWYRFKDAGFTDPEAKIYDFVDKLIREIILVFKQEFFDLHDCEIYNELYEFIDDDLNDIYDGKLSYAYRFEADSYVSPTTYEDYNKAMIRLNSIIEKYI